MITSIHVRVRTNAYSKEENQKIKQFLKNGILRPITYASHTECDYIQVPIILPNSWGSVAF